MELERKFVDLLEEAERHFGPRNGRCKFAGIRFREDGPRILSLANGYFLIALSPNSEKNVDQAVFQLAHETVHMLAPVQQAPNTHRDATMLEEGAAVWFSLNTRSLSYAYRDIAAHHINRTEPHYSEALALFNELNRFRADAVRLLRRTRPCFDDMTPDFIRSEISEVDVELSNRLCEKRWMRTSPPATSDLRDQ